MKILPKSKNCWKKETIDTLNKELMVVNSRFHPDK